MFEKFYPDFFFRSIDDIDEEFFLVNGIKFAILDIDNTLVSYKTTVADKRAKAFLNMLTKNGIKFAFVSNNHKDRVSLFAKEFNAIFVNDAGKPFTFGIKRAMKKIGADKKHTVLIGDQVFTDVYAGKNAGIITVMVNPIEAKETPFFGLKRRMEKIVLKNYKR